MKKTFAIVSIVLALVACLLIIFIGVYRHVYRLAQEKPSNDPGAYVSTVKPAFSGEVLVCVGDSITHGRVSSNYVDMLSKDLDRKDFFVVNAGINGELAYNVLKRLDSIIACNPDYVTVLIGTNDAHGALSREQGEKEIAEMKLPQLPTETWYRENLTEIVRKLKSATHAEIGLLSIPPIGENPTDPAFLAAERYSGDVKEIAEGEKVAYLPLFETMAAYLRDHPHAAVPYTSSRHSKDMYIGIARHFLFNASFDDVSRANGFLLETDYLHLNSTGARLVAELIERFVRERGR